MKYQYLNNYSVFFIYCLIVFPSVFTPRWQSARQALTTYARGKYAYTTVQYVQHTTVYTALVREDSVVSIIYSQLYYLSRLLT